MSVRIYLRSGRYVDDADSTVAYLRDIVKEGLELGKTWLIFGPLERPRNIVRLDAIEAVVEL
jgi:hypothetical protein